MESLSVEVKFEVRGKLDTVPWLPYLGSSKFMSEIISPRRNFMDGLNNGNSRFFIQQTKGRNRILLTYL